MTRCHSRTRTIWPSTSRVISKNVLDMKTHRLFFAGMLTAALLTPNACSKDDTTLANTPLPQETTATAGTLTVKFDYTHYPTLATG